MSLEVGRAVCAAAAVLIAGSGAGAQSLPNLFPFPNPNGLLETYNDGGKPIDLSGPFFQSLGTNGRSCASCHRPAEAWSVSAAELKLRFRLTQGLDPIFRTNDGSVCDQGIDTSTLAGRAEAYRLLTGKGLIRVTISVPDDAEFRVLSVVNPYGCNDPANLALYRRPLPAANLRLLSTVMWDGRESSPQTGTVSITNSSDLMTDLEHQAFDAANGHAQASTPLTPAQQQAIAAFESGLSTAQAYDYMAGSLSAAGATGGPTALATRTTPAFFIGINDPFDPNFTPAIFDLFNAWTTRLSQGDFSSSQRASIARGQALFNSKLIHITGVGGLNDMTGTCGTCHNSPDVGNHSSSVPLNVGVAAVNSPLDLQYLPVITLQNKSTGETRTTTDPGRALVTGKWQDIGKMKGPILRGLAGRAPYFHNGSADSLGDVLEFYDQRFQIGFTAQEKQDLIAFLNSL